MKKFLKNLYNLVPFKKAMFHVLRAVWSPKESVFRHLKFKGVFTVPVGKTGKFKIKHYGYQVENEIFWKGLTNGWEKESIKIWMKLCEKSTVIFDIGANTGIYSLIAKCVNPASQVFAFEPVARVFEKLKANIELNKYDIISSDAAISDKDGTAMFYDLPTEHVYSVTINKNLNAPGIQTIETKVQTLTLDTFIRQHNISRIDLMKIDVETHEPEVLEGFSEYLLQYRPAMLIEILNDEVGRRVSDLVKGAGYYYFNIDEVGSIRQVDTISKSDYYNYLFCSKEVATDLGLISG
ncbi:MAG: FkbM family methyltransferase [Chitinophagaceae bacterium]|nr:FkbM family methyltransferase [Chitinophagaceae bacterium]